MGVVELQAIQVEFDSGPGVRADEIGEVVGELRLGQCAHLMIEVRANSANGARVGVYRLGLQPLELEVLEMHLVLPVKVRDGACLRHAGLSSRNIAESTPR